MAEIVRRTHRMLLWLICALAIVPAFHLGFVLARAYVFREALTAHSAQQFESARTYCLIAAELGSPDAAALLGTMYLRGEGGPKEGNSAAHWLETAADEGNVQAESVLGLMFATGQGVRASQAKARFWLLRASNHGDQPSRELLGTYVRGDGRVM